MCTAIFQILKQHPKDQEKNYAGAFAKQLQWSFPAISDGIKGKEVHKVDKEKLSRNEAWKQKRIERREFIMKQKLSRW